MRTFATALVASVLVAACTVPGDPSATPAPATAMPTGAPPTATPAPATPAPTDTAMLIPATVRFDGTTCTYLGPTVVPLGSVIELAFETTATTAKERASWQLVVTDVKYDAWDDIVAWAAKRALDQVQLERPPWAMGKDVTPSESSPAYEPMRVLVNPRRLPYSILVACGVASVPTNWDTVFPARLIQVLKG